MKLTTPILVLCLLNLGCTGYRYAGGSTNVAKPIFADYPDLRSALSTYPMLKLIGTGRDTQVKMRNAPIDASNILFIVNGTPIGHDYNLANDLINMSRVKTITVSRSLASRSYLGTQSHAGAILIRTI